MGPTHRTPWLTHSQEHCTLPEPALLTLHLAPPVTRTLPEPAISTRADERAFASMLPEPAISARAWSVATCPAWMFPDPAIS
jgi:hypothetical protein